MVGEGAHRALVVAGDDDALHRAVLLTLFDELPHALVHVHLLHERGFVRHRGLLRARRADQRRLLALVDVGEHLGDERVRLRQRVRLLPPQEVLVNLHHARRVDRPADRGRQRPVEFERPREDDVVRVHARGVVPGEGDGAQRRIRLELAHEPLRLLHRLDRGGERLAPNSLVPGAHEHGVGGDVHARLAVHEVVPRDLRRVLGPRPQVMGALGILGGLEFGAHHVHAPAAHEAPLSLRELQHLDLALGVLLGRVRGVLEEDPGPVRDRGGGFRHLRVRVPEELATLVRADGLGGLAKLVDRRREVRGRKPRAQRQDEKLARHGESAAAKGSGTSRCARD